MNNILFQAFHKICHEPQPKLMLADKIISRKKMPSPEQYNIPDIPQNFS